MEIDSLLPPMAEKLRLLSPKPGDFLVLTVESEGEAEFYAEQFGELFANGTLDHKINLMILPAGKSIELLSDEELDRYGLERTEVDEDEENGATPMARYTHSPSASGGEVSSHSQS